MICRHKLYHFTVANTRFTAPLTRRGKTKFATIKWYNLCLQMIQSRTCYPLSVYLSDDKVRLTTYRSNSTTKQCALNVPLRLTSHGSLACKVQYLTIVFDIFRYGSVRMKQLRSIGFILYMRSYRVHRAKCHLFFACTDFVVWLLYSTASDVFHMNSITKTVSCWITMNSFKPWCTYYITSN